MKDEALFSKLIEMDDVEIAGFYWCGGETWDGRDYRVVLLAAQKQQNGRRRMASIELHAPTPEALVELMLEAGCDPRGDIRSMCEDAPCSTQIPRR